MKKIFVSLLIIAASLNAMATDFAVATLTLKGNTSLEEGEVTLVKTDNAAASSFCAPLFIDQYQVAIYAINGSGSEKYQVWANADLTNFPLGIKTYSDANYTITVSNVSGSETLNLYDAVTKQTIPLTNGQTYEFAAAANSTIADRFVINKPVPGICFNDETLQITAYAGAQVELLNYADKASVMAPVTIASNYQEIKLEDVAGLVVDTQYFVKLKKVTGEEEEYVITYKAKTKPVTPAP